MNTRFALLFSALALGLPGTGCRPAEETEEAASPPEVAVTVAPVIRTNLRATVIAYGVVAPAPAQAGKPGGGAQLAAAVASVVREVPVAEGQRVKAGDLIVRLDDRPARAAVDKARHALGYARQVMARQEKLKAVDGTSEKAIQAAQQQLAAAQADLGAACAALAWVQLTAPLDGVVTRLRAQPGQAVEVGTVVAEIVDLDRLVANVAIPAAEAAAVKPGQRARIVSADQPELVRTGEVQFVSPTVDPATGQTLARLRLEPGVGWRPGQFVSARIVVEERAGRLAVPREAVYTDHEGRSTLVVVGQNIAHTRPVKTGLREGNWVEIEGEGLREGVVVVTLGSYALPDGARVIIKKGEEKTD